jgi:hypothetical protein
MNPLVSQDLHIHGWDWEERERGMESGTWNAEREHGTDSSTERERGRERESVLPYCSVL